MEVDAGGCYNSWWWAVSSFLQLMPNIGSALVGLLLAANQKANGTIITPPPVQRGIVPRRTAGIGCSFGESSVPRTKFVNHIYKREREGPKENGKLWWPASQGATISRRHAIDCAAALIPLRSAESLAASRHPCAVCIYVRSVLPPSRPLPSSCLFRFGPWWLVCFLK